MAVMHRQHAALYMRNLAVRSFMHACRHATGHAETPVDERRAERKIERVQAKQPAKNRAWLEFVGEARERAKEAKGGPLTVEETQAVYKKASPLWQSLTLDQKAKYQHLSDARAKMAEHDQAADIARQQKALTELKEERADDRREMGIQHRLSQLRFGDSDWQKMSDIFNFDVRHQSQQKLDDWTSEVFEAVPLPDSECQAALVARKPKHAPNRGITDFTRVLAVNRFDFAGAVFMSDGLLSDPKIGWMLLFATQQPLRCFFMPVTLARRNIPFLPPDAGLLDLQRLMAPIGNWEWTWTPGAFTTDQGLPVADLDRVWVWTDVQFRGTDRLAAHAPPPRCF
jgi:hypothetical protein